MARRTAKLPPQDRWLDTARGCASNNAPGTPMVTLWLPRASSSAHTTPHHRRRPATAIGGSPRRLILEDDDPYIGSFAWENAYRAGARIGPEEVRYGV